MITALIVISFFEFSNSYIVEDRIGLVSFYSQREYVEKHNITFSLFGQKKFLDIFEIRLDVPSGITKGKFLLSDTIATMKINPSEIFLNPSFSLSFEFPTGTTPATSDRLVISPRLCLSRELSENFSFIILVSGNFSPNRTSKIYNTLYPHTFNEVLIFTGANMKILRFLKIQGDIGAIYENFRNIGFQPQIKIIAGFNKLNIHLFSFMNLGGKIIRKGFGIGTSVMYSF